MSERKAQTRPHFHLSNKKKRERRATVRHACQNKHTQITNHDAHERTAKRWMHLPRSFCYGLVGFPPPNLFQEALRYPW